jgi:hypothetical protein
MGRRPPLRSERHATLIEDAEAILAALAVVLTV